MYSSVLSRVVIAERTRRACQPHIAENFFYFQGKETVGRHKNLCDAAAATEESTVHTLLEASSVNSAAKDEIIQTNEENMVLSSISNPVRNHGHKKHSTANKMPFLGSGQKVPLLFFESLDFSCHFLEHFIFRAITLFRLLAISNWS